MTVTQADIENIGRLQEKFTAHTAIWDEFEARLLENSAERSADVLKTLEANIEAMKAAGFADRSRAAAETRIARLDGLLGDALASLGEKRGRANLASPVKKRFKADVSRLMKAEQNLLPYEIYPAYVMAGILRFIDSVNSLIDLMPQLKPKERRRIAERLSIGCQSLDDADEMTMIDRLDQMERFVSGYLEKYPASEAESGGAGASSDLKTIYACRDELRDYFYELIAWFTGKPEYESCDFLYVMMEGFLEIEADGVRELGGKALHANAPALLASIRGRRAQQQA